jgi:hypothetical protein
MGGYIYSQTMDVKTLLKVEQKTTIIKELT